MIVAVMPLTWGLIEVKSGPIGNNVVAVGIPASIASCTKIAIPTESFGNTTNPSNSLEAIAS